jgi:ligand-binding SRPBCC domain-containing protein
MPIIKLETEISAPIERVFDLARSIDLHRATTTKYKEKAVAGVTTGLINLGETVTWEATHFGVKQRLTSKITAFEPPRHFRDSMVTGAFKRFDHDHFFEQIGEQTRIKDVFDYDSPLGILGKIADALFLENHLREMLEERNQIIKTAAEGDDWQRFLNGTPSS